MFTVKNFLKFTFTLRMAQLRLKIDSIGRGLNLSFAFGLKLTVNSNVLVRACYIQLNDRGDGCVIDDDDVEL